MLQQCLREKPVLSIRFYASRSFYQNKYKLDPFVTHAFKRMNDEYFEGCCE